MLCLCCFQVFEGTSDVDGGRRFTWTSADESEIRGLVLRCLIGVTDVAKHTGCSKWYTYL